MPKLNRWIGVRVGFTLVAVVTWFATLFILAKFPALDSGEVIDGTHTLLAVILAAVIGDTLRPSGQSLSAFSGAPGSLVEAIPQNFALGTAKREKTTIIPESDP